MTEETTGRSMYGQFDHEGYPLADWIYGHRLIDGEGWMEYLLEFLNVLVGFDYRLGQGIENEPANADKRYKRRASYGLRRFVFYGESEKRKRPEDQKALDLLQRALEENTNASDQGDPLEQAKELLRSYSAVEASRSWYAKSLFPAHENLLFWEALRKGGKGAKVASSVAQMQATELDEGMDLTARNFFARGGEVYYLILSAGTSNDQALRERIQSRLEALLTQRNQAVGKLAGMIENTWQDLRDENESNPDSSRGASLGWIPEPDSTLYTAFAEDVDRLLSAELDPLETMDLLAHLICFQLLIYIYHHTNTSGYVGADSPGRDGELNQGHQMILIDCLGGQRRTLRQASATRYKEHEQLQVNRAKDYVRRYVWECAEEMAEYNNFAISLEYVASRHFDLGRLRTSSVKGSSTSKKRTPRDDYIASFDSLQKQFERGDIERSKFVELYIESLQQLLLDRFRSSFLPTHRKLARSIGFISPFQGPSQRYVLGDNLLKALVLSNLAPGDRTTYGHFLERLYIRYGLVVDQWAARASGLYESKPINAEYYKDNRDALQQKLKTASLLEEYSDATALVVNQWSTNTL